MSSIFVCSLVVAHWAGSRPHIINTPEDKEEYLLAILVDAHGGPGIIAVESGKGIVLGQVKVDRALERCIARGLLVLPQCTKLVLPQCNLRQRIRMQPAREDQ